FSDEAIALRREGGWDESFAITLKRKGFSETMKKLLSFLFLLPLLALAMEVRLTRPWLLEYSLLAMPGVLANCDQATGRFGKEPWILQDQNVILPLAIIWSTQDSTNPYYHDASLLALIARAGNLLADDQDKDGKWLIRKKDSSTWGTDIIPDVASRWARAFLLLAPHLPPEARQKWERGLRLAYASIPENLASRKIDNRLAQHALGLYALALALAHPEWKNAAQTFFHQLADSQAHDGFWSEHHGPAVVYNYIILSAIGEYYALSKDQYVMEAIRRAAHFHVGILWNDGSAASIMDERCPYSPSLYIGNPAFSWSPIGRSFLYAQIIRCRNQRRLPLDYLAQLLQYGDFPDVKPDPLPNSDYFSSDGKILVSRQTAPWQVALSAWTSPPSNNRWILDRQNLVELFHHEHGLVAGGGNAKMQPLFSTFTFGDISHLQPDFQSTSPNFLPKGPLHWVPDSALLSHAGNTYRIDAKYGPHSASVATAPLDDNGWQLTFTASSDPLTPAEAHLPLKNHWTLQLATGTRITLNGAPREISPKEHGGAFSMGGLSYQIPDNATLVWPVFPFVPFNKNGKGKLTDAMLVLRIPLPPNAPSRTIRIEPAPVPGSLLFPAEKLTWNSPSATSFKLRRPASGPNLLLQSTSPGESIARSVYLPADMDYDFFCEYLTAPANGTFQIYLDNAPVGSPILARSPAPDTAPPIFLTRLHLTKGPHSIELKVTKKHKNARNCFASIKAFYFRPK
ncbi:MAG: hypothetical protein IJJ26_01705, partial [Victivallales bacterium]|nr:hypothetical protein [Victivallales bacterium]